MAKAFTIPVIPRKNTPFSKIYQSAIKNAAVRLFILIDVYSVIYSEWSEQISSVQV